MGFTFINLYTSILDLVSVWIVYLALVVCSIKSAAKNFSAEGGALNGPAVLVMVVDQLGMT